MNPQNSLDQKDARRLYMKYLQDEYSNQQRNLEANKLYIRTGEAPSVITDFRTTDEKLADTERLRVQVIQGLLAITDGGNASEIAHSLGSDELRFVAGALPKIVEELKPVYQLGVPKDVFLVWLQNFMTEMSHKKEGYLRGAGEDSDSDEEDIGGNTPPPPPAIYQESEDSQDSEDSQEEADDDVMPVEFFSAKTNADMKLYLMNLGIYNYKLTTKAKMVQRYQDYHDSMMYDRYGDSYQGAGFHCRRRMKGCGIAVPQVAAEKKKRPKLRIDTSLGVEASKPYVPLGKYVVNRHRLNDNVVMLRQKSGAGLSDYPTHSVSPELGSVLKRMVGGSFPTFDDVARLCTGDKKHLYKISKKCGILDKVSVPKLDEHDKELHRFYVLKGEMEAGNDNKQLIKEFKVLVMKFVNEGILPRREGHSILIDLVAMGH